MHDIVLFQPKSLQYEKFYNLRLPGNRFWPGLDHERRMPRHNSHIFLSHGITSEVVSTVYPSTHIRKQFLDPPLSALRGEQRCGLDIHAGERICGEEAGLCYIQYTSLTSFRISSSWDVLSDDHRL